MGRVNLRVFDCTSRYRDGRPVVDEVFLNNQYDMPVRLADVVRVNALATPLGVPASYRVLRHELRLLLSYLPDSGGDPLSLRLREFRASADHIQRFVSQSVGVGMLTAAVYEVYRWPRDQRNVDHFDVLPIRLAGRYAATGVRPDLLFRFRDGGKRWRLAGEARGRSITRPKGDKVAAEQLRRMDDMLGWSAEHNNHPVTTVWAYTGSTQVKVDLFRLRAPTDPTSAPPPPQSDPTIPLQFKEDPRSEEIIGLAETNVRSAIDQLYASAPLPEEGRTLWGRELRGDWVPADLLGQSNTHLLVGILDRLPGPDAPVSLPSLRDDLRRERAQDRIQVDVVGRLVIAIAHDRDRPPPWSEVSAQLG